MTKPTSDAADVLDALREAIRSSGRPPWKIAHLSHVGTSALARFLRGYDIGLLSAARVADHLGMNMRITIDEPKEGQ